MDTFFQGTSTSRVIGIRMGENQVDAAMTHGFEDIPNKGP
jgi:hypothetical protein